MTILTKILPTACADRLHRLRAIVPAIVLTAVCALAPALTGCGPSSPGQSGQERQETYGKSLASLSAELAEASSAPWTTLQVPVSVKLRSSGLPSLGGTMYMERDREIRLSLRFLGMEMAAARITPDSVQAYVKPQRMYVAEGIAGLTGAFPASLGNLQALLLDRIFTLGQSEPALRGAEMAETPSGYSITPRTPVKGIDYTFGVLLPANRVASLRFVKGQRSVEVVYTDPSPSYKIELSARTDSRTLGADMNMEMDRARWDQPLPSSRFAIPGGYRRISASALLKALNEV